VWLTNYGNYVAITNEAWYTIASYGTSIYDIKGYTNNKILAENAATNSYNPGKYTLTDFHSTATGYGYCQSIYNGEGAAATVLTDTSSIYNGSDAAAGCNGFGHSTMTRYDIPMKGVWLTNYGNYVAITNEAWYTIASYGTSVYAIEGYTNNKILAENAATNAYNPGKYTLTDFHPTSTGAGFCQSIYNGEDAAATMLTDTSSIYNGSDAAAGCNGFGHSTMTQYENPMKGTWLTNYGSYITVTNEAWYSGTSSIYAIEAYTNAKILAENGATNAYNPGKYTLTDFHTTVGGFGYCQSIYNGEGAAATLLTSTASIYNGTNAASGCNGFGHTTMTSYALVLSNDEGKYVDNYGGNHTIQSGVWTQGSSSYNIEAYGNNWVLAQNAATNSWNPGKWSKFMFHTSGSGYGYCQVIYDAATAAAALTADVSATYNATNAASGCGSSGFAHSILSTRV
jgi:hypothetical protein